jgi:pimeloyl-ACP methyl ester carboxylesterase
MEAPNKYAKSGDVHIAYRVHGNGPRDVLLVPGDEVLLRQLTARARVIMFDERGQGILNRFVDRALEDQVGDMLAVMNAAGSTRATVYGGSEGGLPALMLAALVPERVSGLVLHDTPASIDRDLSHLLSSIRVPTLVLHREGEGAGGTPSSRPAESSVAVFRREGDYWTVSWRGKVVRLKDAKGLHYIAYLLAHPGRQVLASELAGSMADLGDAGAVLDAKARDQYRRRIRDLRAELAEAVELNDVWRAPRLRSELESLHDQIAAAVGLGGRNRKAASHSERARLMVTKAIKSAITRFRATDDALGRHLATSIKTGNCCGYDPGSPPTISWQL